MFAVCTHTAKGIIFAVRHVCAHGEDLTDGPYHKTHLLNRCRAPAHGKVVFLCRALVARTRERTAVTVPLLPPAGRTRGLALSRAPGVAVCIC